MAEVWRCFQCQGKQPVQLGGGMHPAPHVGVADGQPYRNFRRNRDYRPANALTTAAANPAGVEAGMRTRAFPATSISIAGAVGELATCPTGAIQHRRRSGPVISALAVRRL